MGVDGSWITNEFSHFYFPGTLVIRTDIHIRFVASGIIYGLDIFSMSAMLSVSLTVFVSVGLYRVHFIGSIQ
jgi:hypothetical protein